MNQEVNSEGRMNILGKLRSFPHPGPMIEYSYQRHLYPTNPKKTIKLPTCLGDWGGGGGGAHRNSSWGMPPGSPNSDPISPKNVIFRTRFQTRPIKSIPVFRPGLRAEVMLSLLKLERKQKKNSSKPFRIRIFLSFFLTLLQLKR